MLETNEASFPVRDVSFQFDDSVPRYWYNGRRAVTVFFNNLSTFFPLGERFFIKSVARYRKHVKDPELLAEVKAFTSQEALHTREHESYNAMLKEQGYDVEAYEKVIAALLNLQPRPGPGRYRSELAATVALEHWTAMLAHLVLIDSSALEGVEPRLAALWRWHAAEECEHKAVAFDVYEQTGGGTFIRLSTMLVTTVVFWTRVIQQQWLMMRTDGFEWNLAEWADLGRYLFVERQFARRLFPLWLAYFAPGFHPWNHDDSVLLERWKNTYAQDLVYRKRANPARVRVLDDERG